VVMPHLLPDVARVQSMKVLGVTINCNLYILEHVNNITRSSAQTIYALQILRAHGMVDSSLHVVYRAVVVAKLTYAASAWWGFASVADRQRNMERIEAVLQRGKRSGLCSGDVPTIAELVDRADDELFEKILCNPQHVLYNSLPNETVSFYELGHRPHNRELINKTSRLSEASFIVRMLYKDIY